MAAAGLSSPGLPARKGRPFGDPGCAHSSRENQEIPAAAILRCAPACQAGASSIAFGLPIAIEAAVVAGSKQQTEK
jgi:hypothetical protein